jgi:hypothetical protein
MRRHGCGIKLATRHQDLLLLVLPRGVGHCTGVACTTLMVVSDGSHRMECHSDGEICSNVQPNGAAELFYWTTYLL